MLGQAHAPRRRLFGIAVAASCFLVLPAVERSRAVAVRTVERGLQAENAALASQDALGRARASTRSTRSLAGARTRLARARASGRDAPPASGSSLAAELKVARAAHASRSSGSPRASGCSSTTATRARSRSSSARGRSTRRSSSSTTSSTSPSINNEVLDAAATTRRRASAARRARSPRARPASPRRRGRRRRRRARSRDAGRPRGVHRRPAAAAAAELAADRQARGPGAGGRTARRSSSSRTTTADRRARDDAPLDADRGTRGRTLTVSAVAYSLPRPHGERAPGRLGHRRGRSERDPARDAHDGPRLRRGGRGRHGLGDQGRDRSTSGSRRVAQAQRLGPAVGHDHARLDFRRCRSRDGTRRTVRRSDSSTPGRKAEQGTDPTPLLSPRVLLVDDHDLFRTGLRTLLEGQGVDVCGEAETGTEALHADPRDRARRRRDGSEHARDRRRRGDAADHDDRAAHARARAHDLRPGRRRDRRDPRRRVRLPAEGRVDRGADGRHPRRRGGRVARLARDRVEAAPARARDERVAARRRERSARSSPTARSRC